MFLKEAQITRIINHLKEGGEIGRMSNSSVEIIIEALEKQVAKKPYEETIATEEGYMTKKRSFFYCCPNCFYHLNEGQKHCDDCGQAIKWGE